MTTKVLEYKQMYIKQDKTEEFKGRQYTEFKGSENTWLPIVTIIAHIG